jgi:hypothetical protein
MEARLLELDLLESLASSRAPKVRKLAHELLTMRRVTPVKAKKMAAARKQSDSGTYQISVAPATPVCEPRKPRGSREPKPLGVIEQVRLAFKPKSRLAAFVGFLLGGFVPLASYVIAHFEYDHSASFWQLPTLLVFGGLCFSAKTVYDWAKLAFTMPVKALGFTVLIEGVMTFSHVGWLGYVALGYLIAVNGVATSCKLALPDRK